VTTAPKLLAKVSTLIRQSGGDWRSAGDGVLMKILKHNKRSGEMTCLLSFAPGAVYPEHDHPGGEELYVLEGDVRIGRDYLQLGDYLHTPPNVSHDAQSQQGCVLLISVPKPIKILKK
jgi:quercetin dioxygenase-like cupin family protein